MTLFPYTTLFRSEEKINNSDIKHANENFKFDKEIAGDINLSDYDFSDFDDEDDF